MVLDTIKVFGKKKKKKKLGGDFSPPVREMVEPVLHYNLVFSCILSAGEHEHNTF